MKYLSVKDYHRFQHYRDRSPPWIKLYNTLLNDFTFLEMSESAQINLVKLWLLASRHDNAIPYKMEYITGQLQPKSAVDIDELIINGFVAFVEHPSEVKKPKPRRKKRKPNALSSPLPASADASETASGVSAKVLELDRVEESRGEAEEITTPTDIPATRGGWPAEAAEFWDLKVTPITAGQCGRFLKPSVDKFGWPAIKAALEKYVTGTPDWKTPRLDLFNKEVNKWVRFGGMPNIDEKGDLTEWGQYLQETFRPRKVS